MVEEDLRRKKSRVLESSKDETDEEDEIERANERDKGDTTAEANESDKQAGVTKEPSEPDNQASGSKKPAMSEAATGPKFVGKRRKLSEEATRRSTRARKGVDKKGVVVIQRIESKWAEKKLKTKRTQGGGCQSCLKTQFTQNWKLLNYKLKLPTKVQNTLSVFKIYCGCPNDIGTSLSLCKFIFIVIFLSGDLLLWPCNLYRSAWTETNQCSKI